MTAAWVQNLTAHWLQSGAIVVGVTLLAAALRLRHPGLRLAFWQTVLMLMFVLPVIQEQQPAAVAKTAAVMMIPVSTGTERIGTQSVAQFAWSDLIVALIASGIVFRLAWLALGVLRLRRLRALPPIDPSRVEEVDAARCDVGINASVRISERQGPLSFGATQPVIVLPRSFTRLDSAGRRAVVLHELIHARRHDWSAALAEEIVLALLWFHPWAWWVRAQIRLAREEAVDREVVARLGAREAYAMCLLSMAGHDTAHMHSGVAFLRRRELRHRLESLFQEVAMPRARLLTTVGLLATALAATAAGAVSAFPFTAFGDSAATAGQENTRRILHLVPADYPETAQAERIVGTVAVEVTVNAAGDVSGFNVINGPAALHDATVAAIRQWKFERARSADVLVVEIGYHLALRGGREVPGWSFTVRTRDAAMPLRVGGDVTPPKVRKEVHAKYPIDALRAKVQGIVQMEVTVDAEGKVTDVRILQSVPELDHAALEAVRQWEFEPTTRNGVAVAVVMELTMQFKLK